MNKPKIKCTFKKIEKYELLFSVQYMDERFRKKLDDKKHIFMAQNGFCIISYSSVEIGDRGCLYLRGDRKEKDNDVAKFNFVFEGARESYISAAKEALVEWAENWDGFKGLKIDPDFDTEVFEVW